ncbi:MAG TPA: antitoxin MazE-like protein [Arthrobacter sp.]|nr:antitoxin MazE-like protein [Arthrobacter sp.]
MPNERTEQFESEARLQALAVVADVHAGDDQDFIEQISEGSPA